MQKQPLRDEAFLWDAMTRHGDAIYRLALCRTQNIQDAEDIYQDVFLQLLRDQTAFTDDEHLKAWLIRVTINRAGSLHRRLWRRRETLSLEQAACCAAPPSDEYRELWEIICALPPKLRTVIHLHYAEGYSTDEIANLTGCRPATVRTRLFRARNQLKNALEGLQNEKPLSGLATDHQGF